MYTTPGHVSSDMCLEAMTVLVDFTDALLCLSGKLFAMAQRARACCRARNMASSPRRRAFSAASSAASPRASSFTTARVTICETACGVGLQDSLFELLLLP